MGPAGEHPFVVAEYVGVYHVPYFAWQAEKRRVGSVGFGATNDTLAFEMAKAG